MEGWDLRETNSPNSSGLIFFPELAFFGDSPETTSEIGVPKLCSNLFYNFLKLLR